MSTNGVERLIVSNPSVILGVVRLLARLEERPVRRSHQSAFEPLAVVTGARGG